MGILNINTSFFVVGPMGKIPNRILFILADPRMLKTWPIYKVSKYGHVIYHWKGNLMLIQNWLGIMV